jgi:pyruvate ferredoxin oxidoreductase gamma subunit
LYAQGDRPKAKSPISCKKDLGENMRVVQNFRWHARAGQGAVTASKALAGIATAEGHHAQAFAEYGAEKRGAPVVAFNRISENPIRLYCAIEEPNWIICMDPTLIGPVDIAAGACLDSSFIINTSQDAAWLREHIEFGMMDFYFLDATRIAVEELGRDIPNSVILGAIVKTIGLFDVDAFEKTLGEKMRDEFSKKVAEGNMRCFKRGFEEVVKG